MQAFIYNLIEQCLSGAGIEMITHPEIDVALFPEAQYKQVFSEENTKLYYEHDLIDIPRPLEHLIVTVGGINVKEHPISYAVAYDIESIAGSEWDRQGYDRLVERIVTIRLSLIASDTVKRQAVAALEYGKIFLWNLLWNPPANIENWWRGSAQLYGFTDVYDLPHVNIAGFDEEEVHGCWFGATYKQVLLPIEHVALRKL